MSFSFIQYLPKPVKQQRRLYKNKRNMLIKKLVKPKITSLNILTVPKHLCTINLFNAFSSYLLYEYVCIFNVLFYRYFLYFATHLTIFVIFTIQQFHKIFVTAKVLKQLMNKRGRASYFKLSFRTIAHTHTSASRSADTEPI